MKTLYTAHGSATGGREGRGASSDNAVDLKLATPKELGGNGATGTNPEQLFAIGYAACFLGAMKLVAGREQKKVPDDATVSADVGIGPRDDGAGFGINVALTITIPGMAKAEVEELVHEADIVCPYSHSLRGNVPVTLTVA